MNFEGRITHLQTLFGKVGKSFWRGETIGLVVAVIGAGVAGDTLFVAAKQLIDGRVVEFARNVPQRNIDGRDADARNLAQGAAHVGVDAFAF
jgi:hypothetical protein